MDKKEKSISDAKNRKKRKEKKIKEVETKKELEEGRKRADDYFKRLKWMQAEYENLQKKIEREKSEIAKFANERLIKNLLDVVDDFERIVSNTNDKEIENGMKMVLKNFMTILESSGVEKMNSLGKKLDPLEHEVVDITNDDNTENGVVVEELRTGYKFKGKVLRSALVRINKTKEVKYE